MASRCVFLLRGNNISFVVLVISKIDLPFGKALYPGTN